MDIKATVDRIIYGVTGFIVGEFATPHNRLLRIDAVNYLRSGEIQLGDFSYWEYGWITTDPTTGISYIIVYREVDGFVLFVHDAMGGTPYAIMNKDISDDEMNEKGADWCVKELVKCILASCKEINNKLVSAPVIKEFVSCFFDGNEIVSVEQPKEGSDKWLIFIKSSGNIEIEYTMLMKIKRRLKASKVLVVVNGYHVSDETYMCCMTIEVHV